MAKPNKKQITVAKMIAAQAWFWQTTNDISSPTHGCDLEESIQTLINDNIIDEEDGSILLEGLDGLLSIIRPLKD